MYQVGDELWSGARLAQKPLITGLLAILGPFVFGCGIALLH